MVQGYKPHGCTGCRGLFASPAFCFSAPAASVSECESPLQLSFMSSFSPYLALTFFYFTLFMSRCYPGQMHTRSSLWPLKHSIKRLCVCVCVLKDKRYNSRFKEHLKSKKVVKGLFAVLLKLTPELSISRKSNFFFFKLYFLNLVVMYDVTRNSF